MRACPRSVGWLALLALAACCWAVLAPAGSRASPPAQAGAEAAVAADVGRALAAIGIQRPEVTLAGEVLTIAYYQPPVDSPEAMVVVWGRILPVAARRAPSARYVELRMRFDAAPPTVVRAALRDVRACLQGLVPAEDLLSSLALKPAEGEATRLTDFASRSPGPLPAGYPRRVAGPAWSPDGTAVVCYTSLGTPVSPYWGSRRAVIHDLYAVAADGSGLMVQITRAGAEAGFGFLHPAFLYPKGDELLVYEAIGQYEFMRLDLDRAPLAERAPVDGNSPGLVSLARGLGERMVSSRDGKRVAWEYRDPADAAVREVRVAPLAALKGQDAGKVGQVAFRLGIGGWVYGLSFSPDGSALAVACRYSDQAPAAEIYVVPTEGRGEPRRLLGDRLPAVPNFDPDWSAKGRIAFTAVRDGLENLYVVEPDGSGLVQVTYEGGANPAWSPTGSHVAFVSSRSGHPEIWTIPVPARPAPPAAGPGPEVLPAPGSERAAPPAAREGRIAYASDVSGDFELYAVSPDGSNKSQLTRRKGEDWFPAWSPDGARIAYECRRGESFALCVLNVRDGSVSVTPLAGLGAGASVQRPAWSPDGRSLAVSVESNDARTAIYVAPAGGGAATLLAYGRDPSWSPDGSRIAYTEMLPTAIEIAVINVDGSGRRVLTRTGGYCRYPAWSPDGSRIAYAADPAGLFVMNADGSGQRRISSRSSYGLAWSPDGRRLAISDEGELIILSADGQEIATLGRGVQPAWSR